VWGEVVDDCHHVVEGLAPRVPEDYRVAGGGVGLRVAELSSVIIALSGNESKSMI
jgi:hypothetical protein